MAARKNTPVARIVPQTSLIDVKDALAAIGATVDVAVAALEGDRDSAEQAAVMLYHNVTRPLEAQQDRIDVIVQALVKPRRRKKRKPNGSRKGKKRQRNRWKQREAERKRKGWR
jgi:hypothetical protein